VGCTRACVFCATKELGFVRQLRAEEMVAQYLLARLEAPAAQPATNVVFMGLRRRSQTDPLSGGWEIHSRGLTAVASPEAGGLAVVVEQDDCLGMKLKRATPRRRCCECRSWYAPKPSTSKTQRTCSKACRLRRRGEREKARRAADLGAARKLERVRQRRHRERRKQTPGPQMSRAGLSVEARETIERIVEELGQLQRLSRAGLGRRLRGFLQGEAARAGLEVET
jgi:hypothetical protein